MLSPDPYVQVPEYSQNFNRYSYVLNNPLNATDPTGFLLAAFHVHKKLQWAKRHWADIGPYVGIVVGIVLCWTGVGAMAGAAIAGAVGATGATAAAVASAALIGGVMGGVNAAMMGGGFGDILRGVVVGALQGAASAGLHGFGEAAKGFMQHAAYVVGHGVVGGLSNVAMGGKFSDGFLSAAASACASQMGISKKLGLGEAGDMDSLGQFAGRTAVAGIIGGTASAVGGGKFSNGAYTAAFQHLLNAEASSFYYSAKVKSILSQWKEQMNLAANKAGVPLEALMMALADENSTGVGLKGMIDGQQDAMAFSGADSLRGKINLDIGPFNINIDTAVSVAAKHGIGSGSINLIAQDLTFVGSSIPYAAAYMGDVKKALDPYLEKVSFDNRIGEYVQGWRQGYENRIHAYTPGKSPNHGMANFEGRLKEIRSVIYSAH
jgi:hypothetical protein